MSVLVVEDDPDIRSLLKRGFEAEGYSVTCAPNGERAMEEVRTTTFDAIVLDLMMPGMSGIHVCEKIRLMGIESTILILSARDSVADRIEGLTAGADDYVVKPFAMEEILARIKAQSRHHKKQIEKDPDKYLEINGLRLDMELNEVHYNGNSTFLTERESDLLVVLIRRNRVSLTRDDIFEALWADQGGRDINLVDVYIGYLRKKLSSLGVRSKEVIRTVRGTGFMFLGENLNT